jgi:hypothetical protein
MSVSPELEMEIKETEEGMFHTKHSMNSKREAFYGIQFHERETKEDWLGSAAPEIVDEDCNWEGSLL